MILIGGISMFMLGGNTATLLGFIVAAILIILTLAPLFTVFQARYMTRVYDSAAREA
jgi:predicted ABC-type exoprotein transport system permease subunit